MPSSNPLSHLDDSNLLELMIRYYAGERVATLLHEFSIQCPASLLSSYFPPEPTHDICRHCGGPMVRPRRSKSWGRASELICTKCAHTETPQCRCIRCHDARCLATEKELQHQQSKVVQFCAERWSYHEVYVEPRQLAAIDALGLMSLVRCGGWLDECSLGPMEASSIRLTPSKPDFDQILVSRLITAGLVSPDANSPLPSFAEQDGKIVGWHPARVQWQLRMPAPVEFLSQLEELVASSAWPQDWHVECREMWHELAAAECWEFCEHNLSSRNLPMPGVTALTSLLENLLRDFSVSQCYQLIWASAGNTIDYRVRKGISAPHAANHFIGTCQRSADRSRAEGWTIKGFRRNFQLGRSQISHVLHDVFLKHGEAGFFSCPNSTIGTTVPPGLSGRI